MLKSWYTQYIYDGFLKIYLFIFAAVADFPLSGASKDLIRNSQRL